MPSAWTINGLAAQEFHVNSLKTHNLRMFVFNETHNMFQIFHYLFNEFKCSNNHEITVKFIRKFEFSFLLTSMPKKINKTQKYKLVIPFEGENFAER